MKISDILGNLFKKRGNKHVFKNRMQLEKFLFSEILPLLRDKILKETAPYAGIAPTKFKSITRTKPNISIYAKSASHIEFTITLPIVPLSKTLDDIAKYVDKYEARLKREYELYQINTSSYATRENDVPLMDIEIFQFIRNRYEFVTNICDKILGILEPKIRKMDLSFTNLGVSFIPEKITTESIPGRVNMDSMAMHYDANGQSSDYGIYYPNIGITILCKMKY